MAELGVSSSLPPLKHLSLSPEMSDPAENVPDAVTRQAEVH